MAIRTFFNNLLSLRVRNVKLLLECLAVLMKKLMRSGSLLEGSKDTKASALLLPSTRGPGKPEWDLI